MNFKSAGIRTAAISLGFSVLVTGLATTGASAQVAYWWGPTPGYGYVPPLPVYRPAPRRYIPEPVYPDEVYEPARARALNPGQVRNMLNGRGLQVTGVPTRNGGVYVADVRDRAGNQRRLIIDGYYGRVLQTFPAGAVRQARPPEGPRYAGRPLDTDIDPDDALPGNPRVIPGIGPDRAPENGGVRRPASAQQKKKPAKKVAAKPPSSKFAPAALPVMPPPAASAQPPVQEQAPPATSALPQPIIETPAMPAPAPRIAPEAAPIAPEPPREAAVPPADASPAQVMPDAPTPPASTASPVTGQPPAAAEPPPQAAKEPEQPADRPRRRVRFIKPDASTIADPNVPGGQLVPIPEPPPVVISPRSAAAAPAPGGAEPVPQVPTSPLE